MKLRAALGFRGGRPNDSPQTLPFATAAQSQWDVPYYVKGFSLGVPLYLVAIHMWTWIFTLPVFLAGRADFRQLYAAAFMVRTGHEKQLYDYKVQEEFQDRLVSQEPVGLPFVSPAYHALFFSPLSLLSYRSAYFAFLAINVMALAFSLTLLRPWTLNLRFVYPWLPVAIVLGFLPIAATLIQGQDSILLTTLLIIAFVLLTKQFSLSAGIVVGLGLFKFSITLPIALLFLIWRCWRFLLGFVITAAVLVSVSVWFAGIAQTKLYLDSLLSIAGLTPVMTDLAKFPVSPNVMANVHGLVFGMGGGWIPKFWSQATTILVSGGVLGWTALQGSRIRDLAGLLILAIPCSILVSHHTYIHDLSVLLLPVMVLLNSFLPGEALAEKPARPIARTAALMFTAPVVESFAPSHFYLVSLPVALLLRASAAVQKQVVAQSTDDIPETRSTPAVNR